MMTESTPMQIQQLVEFFTSDHGLFKAMQLEVLHADKDYVEASVPFNKQFELVRGSGLSNGIQTTVMDSLFGMAVLIALKRPVPIATIDLRMEFVHDAVQGDDLICRAECYATTDEVAYTRGTVVSKNTSQLLASGSGTFMLDTRGPSFYLSK